METIQGRRSLDLDLTGLNDRFAKYTRVLLDLGTGDGRYVRYLAERNPRWFIIGVDSCRENLHEHSRTKLSNMLFVIASAQDLPHELNGSISHITINFPWGSLLESLLAGDSKLIRGLESISRANAALNVRLNGSALVEVGKTLEAGTDRIFYNLLGAGWQLEHPALMDACALKQFPTTWAKRLAFGRDPRAMALNGYIK